MIPCFGIKSETFADAVLNPGSVNKEGLGEAVFMHFWQIAWLSTLFVLPADVYPIHRFMEFDRDYTDISIYIVDICKYN